MHQIARPNPDNSTYLILTLKWKFMMIDVSSAFLYDKLNCKVFISIPIGHEEYEEEERTHVLKLNRALYGCTDAPKLWNYDI